jgi:hypothetical protein
MRYPRTLAVLVCLFSWACINVPEVQQVADNPDAGEPDAPIADSGTPPDSGTQPDASTPDSGIPDLKVRLLISRSITNGDVQLSVTVTGPAPEEVELLVDGETVATLTAPYELRWSTRLISEGTHELSARVTLEGHRFTSEPRHLVVDRTRPRLLSESPLTGAQTVSVHQPIQAGFSEPLDPATVNAESVTLLSGTGVVAAEVVLAPEGTSLTLRPASPLTADTTLRVSLGSTVADLAGNAVQALPRDWEWTVPGYLPLGAPLSASPGENPDARSPSLQIDGSGQPVVAWLDGTSLEPYGIRARRWTGDGWEQLGGVLTASSGNRSGSFCSLEVDGDGRLFVAWDELSSSGATSLRVRRWNGTTWDAVGAPVVPLLQQAVADLIVFRANGQGQLALAFRESSPSSQQVTVWRWNGSAWGVLGGALKVNSTWSIAAVRLGIDAAGTPTVVWSEQEVSGNHASYMRRWNGSVWEVISLPAQAEHEALIVEDSGAPVLDAPAWNGTARSAQLLRWNGSSWAAIGNPISQYPGATHSGVVALSSDAQGRLMALVAEAEVAGGAAVFYVRRWNAGAWEPVGSVYRHSPGLSPMGAVLLAVDSAGQPVLAQAKQLETESQRRRVYVYRPND